MAFGRRVTIQAGAVERSRAEAGRTRRGGYWLGLLTNAGVAALTMLVMPVISQFRLNGATLADLAGPALLALVNLTAVAAVVTLLVDLALRGLGWRRPWIYALACALATLFLYVALALAAGVINPIFALYVAVWPAAVGGWVMGLYRR